jgi:carboxyl-terminal processing protease
MMLRRALLGIACLLASLCLTLLFVLNDVRERAGVLGRAPSTAESARLFHDVMRQVSDYQGIPEDSLYRLAARAMIERSDDPYAELMDPVRGDEFALSTGEAFGGIGVQIDVRDQRLTVIDPTPGGPAERAGLKRGDAIMRVDGASTEGWTTEKAVSVLRGEVGTQVRLGVLRPGQAEPDSVVLTRGEVHITSVPVAYRTGDGIGVVHLASFGQNAVIELRAALESIGADSLRGLVLDLRGNPGGLFSEALRISNLFLERGSPIARTESQSAGTRQEYRAMTRATYPDLPLVLLIDTESASAAEIVAGALQDNDRALLIGSRSYGKGSVQSVVPLEGGYSIKLTTARWLTPLGRALDRPHDGEGMPFEDGEDGAEADPDSARAGKSAPREFRSPSGRILSGTGGVFPDVSLSDSLSSRRVHALVSMTGVQDWAAVRDAVYVVSLRHARADAATSADVAVGAALMRELHQELVHRKVPLSRYEFNRYGDFFREELGRQIAQIERGATGVREYLDPGDRQVQEALGRLRAAGSTRALLAAAPERD